jgi:gas vesicle protein
MRFTTGFVLGALVQAAVAVLVAPGSSCETKCGNVLDDTVANDITCDERAYTSSATGTVFKGCVSCELSSTHINKKETDVSWGLCSYFPLHIYIYTCYPSIAASPMKY